ncbi:glutamine--fructose-6-phosphate transaminase (isomerizing) [Candidatus Woesearchaeota archaeon]|nr:glutamine--fructose-6-phosphate transaminase (isomerizing) [Candidatus Woesearchaeota archaeon]
MCGIIGYIGNKQANDILISGLELLEYRGYDSAGISIADNNNNNNNNNDGILHVKKVKGRVEKLKGNNFPGNMGIGHTRWATHGQPSEINAHPFVDGKNKFALVHNGIIENYLELKEELRSKGITFSSATDSEVLVHLIALNFEDSADLLRAVLKTVEKLKGSYAFCVFKRDQQEIIGARNGSPLVLGLGEQENFLASDVSAIINHTRKVVYLNDFEIARIEKNKAMLFDFHGQEKQLTVKEINWNIEQAQKLGYKHFMLKEIMEQPQVFEDSLKIPITLHMNPQRIIVVACGTASYAGMLGKYLIEKIAKIPVVWEVASEFRYKEIILNKDDLVMAISQSGETADTLAAVRIAKSKGAKTLGLINVMDSTIARESDQVIYTRAGPEIGVASTKAFMSQLTVMYLLANHLAENKLGSLQQLTDLRKKLEQTLKLNEQIKNLANKYYQYRHFLYIGRNLNFPLALEGALKLKEISYIHAEAYPAGELKHGPIALISEEVPTLAICLQDDVYDKTLSNIEEIKAREGKVIAIATEGDEKIRSICDDVIYIPKIDQLLYPILCTIPLQLLAYNIADRKECDIDKPRNLAKSVTVE